MKILSTQLRFQKKISVNLEPHFNTLEFACPCDQCDETLIDVRLPPLLEKIREQANSPLTITSGYRCQHHQDQLTKMGLLTAKGVSTHTLGMAADIKIKGLLGTQIEEIARSVGFKAVGVGSTWCHVDIRSDKIRSWIY